MRTFLGKVDDGPAPFMETSWTAWYLGISPWTEWDLLVQEPAVRLQQPPCIGEGIRQAACIIGSCQLALQWSWAELLTPCSLQRQPKVQCQPKCTFYTSHKATMALLVKLKHQQGDDMVS